MPKTTETRNESAPSRLRSMARIGVGDRRWLFRGAPHEFDGVSLVGAPTGTSLQRNEPVPNGERQSLSPGVNAELGKDALDVAPDRADADVESGRRLGR